jgi:hypothetical protein
MDALDMLLILMLLGFGFVVGVVGWILEAIDKRRIERQLYHRAFGNVIDLNDWKRRVNMRYIKRR